MRPPCRADLSPRGSRWEKLFGAAGGPGSPLGSRVHRPHTAWRGPWSPALNPGALGDAAAFYSPPAFVWVWAPTMGRGGVREMLRSHTAPQPLAPPVPAPAGLASVAGEGLRATAHSCLRSRPPGAAAAAAPPAGAARWYSRAPKASGRGLRAAQRPLGVSPRLCKQPCPGSPCPAPYFPWFPSPCLHSSPCLPSFGRPPASWTLEGIPGSPEGAAKPRLLAPSLAPSSSVHLSGTRAQRHASPWDWASLQLYYRSAYTPGSGTTRRMGQRAKAIVWLISQKILAWVSLRESQGGCLERRPAASPSRGAEGFYL